MTIAIFGATGFIGRHLMYELKDGRKPFIAFSHKTNATFPDTFPIEFENPLSYSHLLQNVTSVILLVTQSRPGTIANRAETEVANNVLPYARFVEVAALAGIRRVIFVSSGGTVYGHQERGKAITEEHPTIPVNAYGTGKLMIETMLRSFLREAGISLTILRPGNPVGNEQQFGRHGLVASAIHAARTRALLEIWGDGSVVRDYFHVSDLSDAILRCLRDEAANQLFNVGTGIGTSINQVLDLVDEFSHFPLDRKYLPSRQADVPVNILSFEKIEKTLGWRPTMDLRCIIQTLWTQ